MMHNGGAAKHSPARNAYDDLHLGLSQKGADPYLRIRDAERTLFGL